MEVKIGTRLNDRDVIESRLGEGGFGVVWKAKDEHLGRAVAIKRLLRTSVDDEKNREAAMHEARASAALQHQNIAQIFEVLELGGDILLIIEYVDGRSLADYLRDSRQT